MSNGDVTRFTGARPCPVCGGREDMPRGHETRCYGFLSDDGEWAHCTREDKAGRAQYHAGSNTYSHKARGPCPCGVEHAPAPPGTNGDGFGRGKPEIDVAYDYRDAAGNLVFQCVRSKNPKGFKQRRPDGQGGWTWNLKGVNPVLYRLPELLAADLAESVVIAEGEKDVDRLWSAGFVATTNPMGAGKWRDDYSHDLKGRHVVILPDNDQPGRDHAGRVARSVAPGAASVKVVELPDLPEKGDVSDFLNAGGTPEGLRRLIDAAPAWTPPADGVPTSQERPKPDSTGTRQRKGEKGGDDTAARLLALAEGLDLFHAPDNRAFAEVPVGGHSEVLAVRAQAFKRWIAREYYRAESRAASAEAMQAALNVVEARALFDGPCRKVFVRVGSDPDRSAFYLDLGNESWQVVAITPGGWEVLDRSPVPFRRAPGMRPLPAPARGGSVESLRKYLNLPDEDAWRLLIAYVVAGLRPDGPYPVLDIQGEQGSAKSMLSRLVRLLIDPHVALLRSEPRDARDLMIAAKASWVAAFDNLSGLPPWLSDALCRLATGGGFSTRALYTDDEEVHFDAMRPVLLNGIEGAAARPDLLDRAILLKLPTIPDERRREEAVIWREFEAEHGAILGGLLDALCAALRLLPGVKLDRLPRMADFARFGEAVGRALGWGENAFLDAYERNREGVNESAAEASLVVTTVRALLADRARWEGMPADLLRELTALVGESAARSREWPTTPRGLTAALTRVAPVLRRLGVHYDRGHKTNKGTPMILSVTPPEKGGGRPSRPSPPSPGREKSGLTGDGRGDGGCRSAEEPSPQPSPADPVFSGPSDGGVRGDGLPPIPTPGPDPWEEIGEWTE